jgi:hypothetical protein
MDSDLGKACKMRTVASEEKSGKAPVLLEWQTCDSDEEWQTPAQLMPTTAASQPDVPSHRSWAVRHWRTGAALLVLLAAIGGWTWSVAQSGVDQIEADLRESVELDLWRAATQDDGLQPAGEQQIYQRVTSAQGDTVRPLTSTNQLLELPGETAIVQLTIQPGPGQPDLRQTRFYRQTAEGWQRTKPDDNLWGPPRTLESSHFIFKFRQNDAQVVTGVASQLDDVYTELQRNFSLMPKTEKLVIKVSAERVTGVTLTPQWEVEPLVVPSPAIYLASTELSDSAILAQSIALPFVEYMGQRAIKEHAIPSRWQPLLRGLQLWQLWNLQMPLAHWQPELVKWLYVDAPTAVLEQQLMLPARYSELCAMHRLWLQSPEEMGIPFKCTDWDSQAWSPSRWATYVPRTRLNQLSVPLASGEMPYDAEANDPFHASEAVTVATLAEYVVAVYGDEKLQALLAALAHYDGWERLIPAVFGVSVLDFEAGWQQYLAQHYYVDNHTVDRHSR